AMMLPTFAAAQSDGLSSGFNSDGTPNTEEGVVPEEGILSPPSDFQELRLVDAPRARLRGLDTLNNTVDDFMIGVGETLIFKRLEVTLEACRYPEGAISDSAYAFLQIRDRREADPRFKGWMLSESPALSALDHPRYDIWVLSCSTS
ncbi:MAG: DUF2155 domain-containing protein, partial [Pseudomonadota bacterium]